jgi:pimeloyl-ACP methyl ester carboxylesterase
VVTTDTVTAMSGRRVAPAVFLLVCMLATACTSSARGSVTQGTSVGISTDGSTADTVEPDTTGPSPTDSQTTEPGTTDAEPAEDATSLEWGPCDDPKATDEALQCATMTVPLDHTDPTGQQLDIALIRVPATDQDGRVGAVLFNPGGPGGSGFDYIAQGGPTISTSLGLDQFDLIGFDPRGVDRSNGIRCLTDAQVDATEYLDETPETPEEEAALADADDQFDTACIAQYGDTLRHYSTDETARDMDAIRVGLGDDQISLLMISYGTYLAATYATMFPDQVRAMVLDSAYEPTGDTVEQEYTTQLVGFEQAFDNWAAWCEDTDTCAFQTDDVGAAWDALAQQLDDTPVTASDGRSANESVLQVATISALYSETEWPVLARALAEARDGDPADLFAMADDYEGRNDDGTFSTIQQSGSIIRCASGLDAAVPDDPAALVAELHELAPRFSQDITADDFEDSCAALMPDVTPAALHYDGDAAVLVVGGTNDPATPFRWAEEMQAVMGDESALVTYTGEGHGFLLTSKCVTTLEAAVLVDLELPDDGTTCDPDPVIERPEWWDDLPTPDGVSAIFDEPRVNEELGFGPTLAYTELHTSAMTPSEVLDAYDDALSDDGFQVGDRQEPLDGLEQGVYLQPDGELFSVLAIGPDTFDEPEFEGLADLVPTGQTLIVLLTLSG